MRAQAAGIVASRKVNAPTETNRKRRRRAFWGQEDLRARGKQVADFCKQHSALAPEAAGDVRLTRQRGQPSGPAAGRENCIHQEPGTPPWGIISGGPTIHRSFQLCWRHGSVKSTRPLASGKGNYLLQLSDLKLRTFIWTLGASRSPCRQVSTPWITIHTHTGWTCLHRGSWLTHSLVRPIHTVVAAHAYSS